MILSLKQWALILFFSLYSFGVWHISSKYTSSGYEKEKATAIAVEVKKTEKAQALADDLGNQLETEKNLRKIKQKEIDTRVRREIQKPVYSECITPDDGVRLIEDAIDNRGKTSSK